MGERVSEAKRDSLLIFAVGMVLFLAGLSPEFLGFQARFGLFARQMHEHGPGLFPETWRGPYPDYPSAPFLLIYAAGRLAGKMTPWVATAPTAAASAAVLVLIYRLGAFGGRRWGVGGVLMAVGTYTFLAAARSVSLDAYTTLATTLVFYLAYSADREGRFGRCYWIPVVLAGGFACRGPIGLVVPAAVLGAYYLAGRQYRRCLATGTTAAVLFVACGAALLLAARQAGGAELVNQVLHRQAAGRLGAGRQGFAFYWLSSLGSYAASYPLAIAAVVLQRGLVRRPQTEAERLWRHLAIWAAVVLLGMSLAGDKKSRYVLPMAPAAALVAAYPLTMREAGPGGGRAGETARRWGFGAPAVLSAAALAAWAGQRLFTWFPAARYLGAALALAALAAVGWVLQRRLGGAAARTLGSLAAAAGTFVAVEIMVVEPLYYQRETTRPTAARLEGLWRERPGPVVGYRLGEDGEILKLLVNLTIPVTPEFTNSAADLLTRQERVYYIAGREDFERLPAATVEGVEVLFEGRLGHRPAVVFTQKERGEQRE